MRLTTRIKDITKKLLKGDIRSLFESSGKNHLHPVEVAQVLNNLPPDSVTSSFVSFSYEGQLEIFPYLDSLVQKQLIQSIPKENARKLLNAIILDDRVSFFSAIPHHEIGEFFDLLDEKNKKATLDILGFPKQSVARLINTQYATLKKNMTIAEANSRLTGISSISFPDSSTT